MPRPKRPLQDPNERRLAIRLEELAHVVELPDVVPAKTQPVDLDVEAAEAPRQPAPDAIDDRSEPDGTERPGQFFEDAQETKVGGHRQIITGATRCRSAC